MWRVVIADDEIFIREGLKHIIEWEKLGFELAGICKNGQEVLELIPKIKPFVVILDIQMPIMDGLETAKIIQKKWSEIIVIILTAYEEFQYAKRAIEAHVQNYVIKNDVFEELPDILKLLNMQLEIREKEKCKNYLRDLMYDSKRVEMGLENQEMYKWYKNNFPEYRLMIIRGENNEELLKDIEDVLQNDTIQIISVSPGDWCVLLRDADTKDVLMEKCSNLCKRYLAVNKEIIVSVSKVYNKIEQIKEGYREVLQYLEYHFLDWEKEKTGFVFAEHKRANREVDLLSQFSSLMKNIEMGKIENYREKLDLFFLNMRESSEEEVRSIYLMMFEELYKICQKYNITTEKLMGATKNDVRNEILRGTRVSELEDIISLLVEHLIVELDNLGRKSDIIYHINMYIEENYFRKLSLNDVAEYVHISPSYLSKLYKQETGEKLFDVINKKRIKKAEEYIRCDESKISEIAMNVGFVDMAYFSKVFKKYTGFSPKEYRNRARAKEEVH